METRKCLKTQPKSSFRSSWFGSCGRMRWFNVPPLSRSRPGYKPSPSVLPSRHSPCSRPITSFSSISSASLFAPTAVWACRHLQVNDGGWGDAPEHVLCRLMQLSGALRSPAECRVVRLVCKRWRKTHDDALATLKPSKWHEGNMDLTAGAPKPPLSECCPVSKLLLLSSSLQ